MNCHFPVLCLCFPWLCRKYINYIKPLSLFSLEETFWKYFSFIEFLILIVRFRTSYYVTAWPGVYLIIIWTIWSGQISLWTFPPWRPPGGEINVPSMTPGPTEQNYNRWRPHLIILQSLSSPDLMSSSSTTPSPRSPCNLSSVAALCLCHWRQTGLRQLVRVSQAISSSSWGKWWRRSSDVRYEWISCRASFPIHPGQLQGQLGDPGLSCVTKTFSTQRRNLVQEWFSPVLEQQRLRCSWVKFLINNSVFQVVRVNRDRRVARYTNTGSLSLEPLFNIGYPYSKTTNRYFISIGKYFSAEEV